MIRLLQGRMHLSRQLFPPVISVLALAGCSLDYESNVTSGNRDQVLHFGNADEPAEIDPHITTGIPEFHIQHALFEGLVAKHPATLEIVPAVARSWEFSNNNETITFYLREDARWSNGDPVTTQDFIYSWRRALTPALGNLYAYMFFYIRNAESFFNGEIGNFDEVGVKATDDHTLVVELNGPVPFFLQLLDHHSYFPVHPPTIERFGGIARRGSRWSRPVNFVGNGPFVLKEWKLNRILKVERNPHYWDAKQVRLQAIHFYPVQNESTEERMFRSGQLHITDRIPTEKIAIYRKNNPDVLHITPYLGTYFYRFNTTVPPLDDVRVRRALAMSINREQIVSLITKGGQIPAETLTPADTNGYTAASSIPYNVDEARRQLAAAGFTDGRGFPALELMFNTSEEHRKIAIAIQQMWRKELNIHVTLSNHDWKVYLNRESRLDYQISRAAWIGDYLDPTTFLDMFITGGGNNRTGFSNSRYDQLISESALVADQEKRYTMLREAEAILAREVPVAPIYTYTQRRLIAGSVKGWQANILDQHPYKYLYLEED